MSDDDEAGTDVWALARRHREVAIEISEQAAELEKLAAMHNAAANELEDVDEED